MQRIVSSTFAVLGAVIALAFGAAPAQAQYEICGALFDECEIAEDVLDWNLDEFEDFFPLDQDTCTALAMSALKQCQAAVKGAVKCWSSQMNYIPKNAKPVCKTEGDFAKPCSAGFKDNAAGLIDSLDVYEESELECCGFGALELASQCMDPP